MTRKDYRVIAECIAALYRNHSQNEIGYAYCVLEQILKRENPRFSISKFKSAVEKIMKGE